MKEIAKTALIALAVVIVWDVLNRLFLKSALDKVLPQHYEEDLDEE